jgi:hypothetical protein
MTGKSGGCGRDLRLGLQPGENGGVGFAVFEAAVDLSAKGRGEKGDIHESVERRVRSAECLPQNAKRRIGGKWLDGLYYVSIVAGRLFTQERPPGGAGVDISVLTET